jgi:hypothetical protein
VNENSLFEMDYRDSRHLTNIGKEMKPTYKIAGFFKQMLILSKKNWILSMRNKTGTLVEIIAPIVLVFFLLALRSAVENQYKEEQNLPLNTVYDDFRSNLNLFYNYSKNWSVIYYFPDNSLIKNIVERSIEHIKNQTFGSFDPISRNQ